MPTKPAPKKKTAVKRSNKPNIAKARKSPLVKSVTEIMHKLLDDIIFADMSADERRREIDLFLTNVGNGVEFGKKAGGDLRAGKDVDPNKLIDLFGKAKSEPHIGVPVLQVVQHPQLIESPFVTDKGKSVFGIKTESGEKAVTVDGVLDFTLNIPSYGYMPYGARPRYQPDFEGGSITIHTDVATFGPFHFARRLTTGVLGFAERLEATLAKKAGA